jgi:glycerol-3-phosphate acyltransferase PlsY
MSLPPALVLALFALLGYLCGAIPFAALLARIYAPGLDLSNATITYNNGVSIKVTTISANTLSRLVSRKLGIVCSILDMLKAFIPTLAVRLAFPEHTYFLMVAAAAVAGHNWPVFNRFRGGSGFTPTYGGLLAIDWLAIPVSFTASALVQLLVRNIFLAFSTSFLVLIPWLWFRTGSWEYVLYAVAVTIFYVLSLIPAAREAYARRKSGEDLTSAMRMSTLDVFAGGDRIKRWFRR